MLDPQIQMTLAWFMALVFAIAGVQKLRQPTHYATVISHYRLTIEALSKTLAYLFGLAEVSAALLLVTPDWRLWGVAMALMLFSAYSIAMAINLGRGRRDFDCGCGGAKQRNVISGALLWRNLGLAMILMLCALPGDGRDLIWLDYVASLMAASVGLLAYYSADSLLAGRVDWVRS